MEQPDMADLLTALPLEIGMWALTGIALVVFVVFSAILLWHWNVYSTGKFTTVSTMVVYLAVAGGFFVLMTMSAVWYTLA